LDSWDAFSTIQQRKNNSKKVTQYGSLEAVSILLVASLIPQLQEYGQPFAMGAIISSLMGIFGAGRIQS